MSGTDAPAAAWVASGAASLTGLPDGPGLVPPAPVLDRIARLGTAADVDPWAVLAERAAVTGLRRRGQVSCGGGTRLLPAEDGWVAVSLVRPDDVEAVPAWLELTPDDSHGDPSAGDPWPAVAAAVARRAVGVLVARGTLLGLPVAAVGEASGPGAPASPETYGGPSGGASGLPGRWTALGPGGRGGPGRPDRSADGADAPLVVDLSSLWAGPLCARTLAGDGAVIVKVEAAARPDGARRGPARFYDRLHAGHRAVALDLAAADDRRALLDLVAAADVVIEASRPSALAQLGVDPAGLGPDGPRVWLSITGHGREGAAAARIGFGDDAAAAGGLVAPTPAGPVFVADAVADPLTGMAAAVAAREGLRRGGRWLVDLPLAGVAAWVAAHAADDDADAGAATAWRPVADPPAPPTVPAPGRAAPPVGADTAAVLAAVRTGSRLAP